MKRKITKQAVIHAKKIISLYEKQEKAKSGVKNKEVEDCMHYEYRGNLQDGWWKCVLLTKCGWRGREVECEGRCQFYDKGEKNKHGIVIGPSKKSYDTGNRFI